MAQVSALPFKIDTYLIVIRKSRSLKDYVSNVNMIVSSHHLFPSFALLEGHAWASIEGEIIMRRIGII